jgi:superfamily I DNA/RNA helicase
MSLLTLDLQQEAVVSCQDEHIAVQAYAGTGKSTTLAAYAQCRPRQRMLYLAFNKSAAEHARQRFPKNVACYTPHALAWKHMQGLYGPKMRHRPLSSYEVAQMLQVDLLKAALALRALNVFLASADPKPNRGHVRKITSPIDMDQEDLLNLVKQLWLAMSDPGHPCPISHDGYLKAFQLSWPTLHGFDTILLDEAQDTSPAVLDIILSQSTAKVFVGDEHQSIYGWRGAINALAFLPRATRLTLDGSYRFGAFVGDLARAILHHGKGIHPTLKGRGQDTIAPIVPGPHSAMVFRTNSVLFDQAVRFLQRGGGRIHFVGGVENYSFDGLLNAWYLLNHDLAAVKDPVMKSLGSFEALEAYAASIQDIELKTQCRIAKNHPHLPSLVEAIKKHAAGTAEQANIVMGTAHRFKGLEAQEVRVGEDFVSMVRMKDRHPVRTDEKTPEEEINLAYVAVTRASRVIDPPHDMLELLMLDDETSRLSSS